MMELDHEKTREAVGTTVETATRGGGGAAPEADPKRVPVRRGTQTAPGPTEKARRLAAIVNLLVNRWLRVVRRRAYQLPPPPTSQDHRVAGVVVIRAARGGVRVGLRLVQGTAWRSIGMTDTVVVVATTTTVVVMEMTKSAVIAMAMKTTSVIIAMATAVEDIAATEVGIAPDLPIGLIAGVPPPPAKGGRQADRWVFRFTYKFYMSKKKRNKYIYFFSSWTIIYIN